MTRLRNFLTLVPALLCGGLLAQTISPVALPALPQVSYFHLWRNVTPDATSLPPRQDYQTVDRAPSPCILPTGVGEVLVSSHMPATASSNESTTLGPANVDDGSLTSRWASAAGSAPQWLAIDFGSPRLITHVRLTWEAAYAKSYAIQTSLDGVTWTSVFTTTTGHGGVENVVLSTAVSTRYVRMYGTVRGTSYGYSLYEMESFSAGPVPVCVSIWIIDRTADVGIGGVNVTINGIVRVTDGGGLVSTWVPANAVFTLAIADVAGYTPSPIKEGLSKAVDAHAVLGLLELAKKQ